jgi:hypothetical protein
MTHEQIYGCAEADVDSKCKGIPLAKLDYYEASMALEALEVDGGTEVCKNFHDRFAALEGLDDLPFQKRCQFITFLVSTFAEHRHPRKKVGQVLLHSIVQELPQVEVNFQYFLDQFTRYDPKPEKCREVAKVFVHAITNRKARPLTISPILSEVLPVDDPKRR